MHSKMALSSAAAAATAVLIATVAVAGTWMRFLPPLRGFMIFIIALLLGGAVSVILGAFGIWRTTKKSGRTGRRFAVIGAVGGLAILLFAFLLRPAEETPPIHDVTTNPSDAPSFVAALEHEHNRERDLTYPHGGSEVVRHQERAYPDLAPIQLASNQNATYDLALATSQELGWQIVDADRGGGRIEATHETDVFRFVDDVVIRIRSAPSGSGSVVDLRSTSRVGVSDLGANAARIRSFRDLLLKKARGS